MAEVKEPRNTLEALQSVGQVQPCAKCGSNDLGEWQSPGWYVQCEECGAEGPSRETPAEAVDAWNAGQVSR